MIPKEEFEALLRGVGIEGDHYGKFSVYCGMLQDWNQRMNLTAITDDEGVAVKHFADSLLPLTMAQLPQGARLIDVEWESEVAEEEGGQYLAEIKMYAYDRQGLLMEISKIFTEAKLDVKSLNVRTSKKGTATIEAGFIVHGREELADVSKKLRQLDGIIDIERAAG